MALTPNERYRDHQWVAKINKLESLIQSIKDALNTEEDGEALVEVARNAHRAEMAAAFPIKEKA